MTQRAPLPLEFQSDQFLAREALDAGVSPRRLRAKDLSGSVWGTRNRKGQDDPLHARCRALMLRLPAFAMFSHVTAARLAGLPVPIAAERRWAVDAAVPAPHRAPDIRGVRGHQLRGIEGRVTHVGGIPITRPERTLCDLASVLSLPELIAVGDHLIRRGGAMTSVGELANALETFPGRRGRASLEAAIPMLSDRAESPAESMLRAQLLCAGLPRLLVNRDVRDTSGRFVARPDLRFADYPILIEYEGDYHRLDRQQWMKDVARADQLQVIGFTVVRVTAQDIHDPGPLVARLTSHLVRAGWSP